MMKRIACLALLIAVSACDSLPDWVTGSNEEAKLPGKRIDVLSEISTIKADPMLANNPVSVPLQRDNENWRQAGGSPQGLSGNLAFSGFNNHEKIKAGDGNGWDVSLATAPIIANATIFTMDAKGYITAYDAKEPGNIKWENKSAVAEQEPDLLGGGLAFDAGHLYVTSGKGKIFAIDAATGKELWNKSVGVPLRAAPKAVGGKIYVISVDNQLFVLDSDKGAVVWNQRGINENAGYLASISPAATDTIVIVPYSSGEIHALDSSNGQELWTDTLLKTSHNSATAQFSGIGGNPVIKDDTVYVSSSNGYLAAFSLGNGRRLWQQEVSSLNTAWLTDDYIYSLSVDSQLLCLQRNDGRIKWVKSLPAFENEAKRKNPYFWHGPVLANGNLLVAGEHGQMLLVSPKSGEILNTMDIPSGVSNSPIIAGGRLYLLTRNAKLHIYY